MGLTHTTGTLPNTYQSIVHSSTRRRAELTSVLVGVGLPSVPRYELAATHSALHHKARRRSTLTSVTVSGNALTSHEEAYVSLPTSSGAARGPRPGGLQLQARPTRHDGSSLGLQLLLPKQGQLDITVGWPEDLNLSTGAPGGAASEPPVSRTHAHAPRSGPTEPSHAHSSLSAPLSDDAQTDVGPSRGAAEVGSSAAWPWGDTPQAACPAPQHLIQPRQAHAHQQQTAGGKEGAVGPPGQRVRGVAGTGVSSFVSGTGRPSRAGRAAPPPGATGLYASPVSHGSARVCSVLCRTPCCGVQGRQPMAGLPPGCMRRLLPDAGRWLAHARKGTSPLPRALAWVLMPCRESTVRNMSGRTLNTCRHGTRGIHIT